ncbi:hypothetical protein RhiirA4_495615 [Rhizophagus irregularis]|uniref:Protein kinase domain-containing protein n=1 Tax=Rhizophagus irregularis TaxID=588596 RepID=A0A2I1GZN5_9GLOM|nr:hypothetical protein RhiirA4_495615 [Rhizophagus irregularis]
MVVGNPIQRYPYTTCYRNTRILDGVIPYMDPKFFEENHSYGLTEKSDIYNLGVLFWELTSRLSRLILKIKIIQIKQDILNSNKLRETPIPSTNDKFVSPYKRNISLRINFWEFLKIDNEASLENDIFGFPTTRGKMFTKIKIRWKIKYGMCHKRR